MGQNMVLYRQQKKTNVLDRKDKKMTYNEVIQELNAYNSLLGIETKRDIERLKELCLKEHLYTGDITKSEYTILYKALQIVK